MTVKRQHLIWRKYLSPWTDSPDTTDGHLYCFDKLKHEIRFDSIENLGVQNYAYDISMINENDKEIIIQLFEKFLKNKLNGLKCCVRLNESNEILQKDFIENRFISIIENQGLQFLEDLYAHKFPFDGPTELELIKEEFKTFINETKGNVDEKECNSLLERLERLKNIPPQDNRFDFFMYITVQMLRTWKIKNDISSIVQDTIQQFPETKFNNSTKAIFPLMMIINSITFAISLCEKNFFIELITNNSEREFLTCDFPVINFQADYRKREEDIIDLIIYYPLTPHLAIKCTNKITMNIRTTIESGEEVDEYNCKMINAAERQIYSRTKEELEFYLKNKAKEIS